MTTLSQGLGVLALAADMSTGRPKGSGLTAAIVSVNLADKLGMSVEDKKAVYYTAAARFLGCTITSHETAMMAQGDDQGFAVATMIGDWSNPESLRASLDEFVARDAKPEDRNKAFDSIVEMLPDAAQDFTAAHCRQAFLLAQRLPIPDQVAACIPYYYARWDEKILSFKREEIPSVSRVVRVAEIAELIRRLYDRSEACSVIQRKAGNELDPEICKVFLRFRDEIFKIDQNVSEFEAFIEAEPGTPLKLTPKCTEMLAQIAADLTDNKSVYFAGHSRRVASLVTIAAEHLKLPKDKVDELYFAALVHDIGKTAVTNRIWYKENQLSTTERIEMESHSYHTEYILSHADPFRQWAHLASCAQERADGSGYHKRVVLDDLICNILAVANEYDELTHNQPYRKAIDSQEAMKILTQSAKDKKFLPTAVSAILHAAGHKVKDTNKAYPFDLTRREAQVLTRLAKSESTAQIADGLYISPKTADHHIQNIYTKTGTRGRPAIALFAHEHGIVAD